MKIEKIDVNERTAPWKQKSRVRNAYREYNKVPRIYVSVKDENILQNLANRTARPQKLYATVITPAIQALGLDPTQFTARWSQTAGCSCPCSPGFIVAPRKGCPEGWRLKDTYKDCWVTVSGDDAALDPELQPRSIPVDILEVVTQVAAENATRRETDAAIWAMNG